MTRLPGIGRRQLLWLGPALLLGAASRTEAHRAHVTLSRLQGNPRAGSWELAHSLHYHDAAQVLARLAGGRRVEPATLEGRARLALEVERCFRILGPDGRPLAFGTVGSELEGDSVVVYQELPAPVPHGTCTVECTLFQDVFPGQVNNVSVELAKPSVALRLSAESPRATFSA